MRQKQGYDGRKHTMIERGRKLGHSRCVVELVHGVDVLDREGLVTHVTLLFLVVNVYGDVGRH